MTKVVSLNNPSLRHQAEAGFFASAAEAVSALRPSRPLYILWPERSRRRRGGS